MRHFHLCFFIDKHHDFKKGHLFVLGWASLWILLFNSLPAL